MESSLSTELKIQEKQRGTSQSCDNNQISEANNSIIDIIDEDEASAEQQHTSDTDNMAYSGEEGYGNFNIESESNETNCNNNSEYIASTCIEVTNSNIQQTDKNSRKRKLDEDGFVTPATPDIPKSSSKYDMTHQSGDDSFEEYYVPYNDECTNQQLYNEEDPLITNTSQYETAADLLRDKAEEFKMVTLEWCREFGDSENFESFCATRLDQLIADAQSLEENLKKQKEILRQRLGFISRTLQEV